ncbi:MAG: hypothetical protein IPI41_03200 [Flavobacteriales bacterium]|nr:hypothetical protein [Flavobacteriales bacterium]
MDTQTVRAMALDMPGTAEKGRYGRPSFSVKKKTYLNLWIEEQRAVLKLTPAQQVTFATSILMRSHRPKGLANTAGPTWSWRTATSGCSATPWTWRGAMWRPSGWCPHGKRRRRGRSRIVGNAQRPS